MNTVDWLNPVRQPRIVNGKVRYDTRYKVTCACGNERWLRKADALKAGPCFTCAQRAKGRKGYQATVARHGKHIATEKLQAYRLAHPSDLERQVMGILNRLGVQYEREVWLESVVTAKSQIYLIDFVINGRLAIEVNGDWAHQFHRERDRQKCNAIRQHGFRLLVLEEGDMPQAETILDSFLKQEEVSYGVHA